MYSLMTIIGRKLGQTALLIDSRHPSTVAEPVKVIKELLRRTSSLAWVSTVDTHAREEEETMNSE